MGRSACYVVQHGASECGNGREREWRCSTAALCCFKCLRCLCCCLLSWSAGCECVIQRIPVGFAAYPLLLCVAHAAVQAQPMHTRAHRRTATPTARCAIAAFSPSSRADRMKAAERTRHASTASTAQLQSLASPFLARSGPTTRWARRRSGSDARMHVQQSQKSVAHSQLSSLRQHPLPQSSSTCLPQSESRFALFRPSTFHASRR